MARQDDGDAGSNRPVRILGLIEWGLGHRTHGMNLGRAAQGLEDIDVTWHRLAAPTARAWCPDWTSNWTTQSGLMAGRYIHDARRSSATDIVFCHSYVPAVLGRSQLGRLPLVVSIDATPLQIDQMDGYEHSAGPATLERFKHLVVRRCFDRAVHVLAVSDWAKTGLVDGYGVPEDKITTIPFGVQIDRFVRPEGRQRNRSDVTRLLFVGGEFDRKGGPLLLSVFDELRSRHRIELDIVTDDAISVPPGVRVHTGLDPLSPELIECFHSADVFCLPSRGDCMPLVLAEAAAAGLPAVCTRVGATAELVGHDDTGVLVDVDDRRQLAHAIEQLVVDLDRRAAMSARAVTRARTVFDSRTNGERTLALLRDLARGRRR